MARKIEVEIVGDASSYNKALSSAQKTTTSTSKKIMSKAALGGIGAAVTGVGIAAKIGWDEYNEGAKVAAQTTAVLKSTAGAANVTAKEVDNLAVALMNKSGVDDEAIKSGENLLLTFTNIQNKVGKGNDIFTQATKIMLDMSVALGQDTKSSAIQLGKALNDPIKGITALQRVGVSFTQAQRDQITALVEAGNTMKAQKIILAELTKEFGGSARAAGKTFAGQLSILHERLNNFLGLVVQKAIPLMQQFVTWAGPKIQEVLKRTNQMINTWRKAIEEVTETLRKNEDALHTVMAVLSAAGKVLGVLTRIYLFQAKVIATVWVAEIKVAIGFIQALASVIRFVGRVANAVKGPVAAAFKFMLGPILTMINAVQRLIDLINRIPVPHGSSAADVSGIASPHTAPAGSRATGGPVSRGRSYLVGERGPELFVPRGSGRIIPNGGSGGGSVQVIVLGGDRSAIDWLRGLDERQGRRSGRGIL